MTRLETVLRIATDELSAAGVGFALIGGLAVSVRTEPRFTRDADVAVAVTSDAEAESVILRLRRRGFAIDTVLEQHAVGRLATVRLLWSEERAAPVVDLLFASSGIEPEVVVEAELLEIVHDLYVPVARAGHLIALKILSRDDDQRPQDLADLRALLAVASAADITRARQAVTLIQARGYHRGRQLTTDLDTLLS